MDFIANLFKEIFSGKDTSKTMHDIHRLRLPNYFTLKEDIYIDDLMFIRPELLQILAEICLFSKEYHCQVVITSLIRTPEEDRKLGAKSKTHQEARAADISLRPELGWNSVIIQKLVDRITEKFSHIGAIKDGQSRPIVVHKNSENFGIHAHLQVRP